MRCASIGFASHSGRSGDVEMKWGRSTEAARRARGQAPSLQSKRGSQDEV